MKKYFLIAIAALIALPLFNSCSEPSGEPKDDAENFRGVFEKAKKLEIEELEKQLEIAEFYAEQDDYKGYQKFLKKKDKLDGIALSSEWTLMDPKDKSAILDGLGHKVYEVFYKEHKDEIKEINKRINRVTKKLDKNEDDDE